MSRPPIDHDSSAFDRGIAVQPAGEARWHGEVEPKWNIGSAPNGGYLLSIALSALREALPHPDPVAVSAHYPSRVSPGPVEVQVEAVRAGRGHSVGVAWLEQGGERRVYVGATFGDLGAMDGPTIVSGERPDIPGPDACIPAAGPIAPQFLEQFDMRLTPESAGFAVGLRSGRGLMEGWVRFADGREPDSLSLPLFADSFPPTMFHLLEEIQWVPTIELTVHGRGRPVPGWLQCRFQTRYVIGGYLEEDGEIWDQAGTLVALSRQLAKVRG
ncbi:MAG: thioesterase family protein [Actinomycetota bacterium]|nr:thioesterase family protein [Actinomycetota bacterium]